MTTLRMISPAITATQAAPAEPDPEPDATGFLIIVDRAGDWRAALPRCTVIEADDFLANPVLGNHILVINLCRSYKYLSVGYYCSLMAQARGQQVLPSVKTINDLSRKAIYSLDTGELDRALNDVLGADGSAPMPVEFSMGIRFGCTDYTPLAAVARSIFETFPAPLMRVEFARGDERGEEWHIAAIRTQGLKALGEHGRAACEAALGAFAGLPQPVPGARRYHYRIAVLHDPDEELAPSNAGALARLGAVGRELGLTVELIGRQDFARLAEFDALFIRETTAVNHHTYLFAKKAESEGLVVIDDAASILRCTNKVYLADLLRLHGVPTPRTFTLQHADAQALAAIEAQIDYPMVVKIPDGAFSRGVMKVKDAEEFTRVAEELLQQSALILVQEYMFTEFDWRIGVLNRQVIFASKYWMSKGHWQVAKRDANGKAEFGMASAVPLDEAPADLLAHALHAANLIGDGLYGVDMKMTSRGPVVIEVNENPNIDAGAEDSVLGDELYRIVLREFVRRLDLLHRPAPGAPC
jgi:glutathione synthase/RimK-type ligase-like ATP-grasp enzyme